MKSLHNTIRNVAATLTLAGAVIGTISLAQTPKSPPPDAVQSAQTTRSVGDKRPEQKLSAHDQSAAFKASNAAPSSAVFKTQPDDGEVRGFDFYRDPLNAKRPMQTAEEITAQDKAMKPKVMEAQRSLLEKRYNLIPKLDPEAKMSRGKPLPVGPTARLSAGVTCLDCHVNGHTTAQFHLNPDDRPQQRRMRLDTVSLRGLFNQQVHGSKRSLRSVEDFTEFEQRTAYFNGDEIHAFKKGANILDRVQVSHMAQMQNMFDFPPAPKLDPATSRLDPAKANESEIRGEKLFFGKAQCV